MLNDVFFINRKRIRRSPSNCFKNQNQAIENEKTKAQRVIVSTTMLPFFSVLTTVDAHTPTLVVVGQVVNQAETELTEKQVLWAFHIQENEHASVIGARNIVGRNLQRKSYFTDAGK
jgi:hypothetical protein